RPERAGLAIDGVGKSRMPRRVIGLKVATGTVFRGPWRAAAFQSAGLRGIQNTASIVVLALEDCRGCVVGEIKGGVALVVREVRAHENGHVLAKPRVDIAIRGRIA